MKNLENDLEILIVPIGILVIVFAALFLSGKLIFDKIGELNSQLAQNQQMENTLKAKLTSLETVTAQVSYQSEASAVALPGQDSSIQEVSQIQTQAKNLDISISDLNSNGSVTFPGTTVNSTELDFNADGSYTGIAQFINGIKSSTPINRFDTIKIASQTGEGGTIYRLSAVIFSYWSPLPTTIPAISAPIESLSDDEKQLIT